MSLIVALTLCFSAADVVPVEAHTYIATRDGVRYLVTPESDTARAELDAAFGQLAVTQMNHAHQCVSGNAFQFPAPSTFTLPIAGDVQVDAVFVVKSAGQLIAPSPSIASVGNQ